MCIDDSRSELHISTIVLTLCALFSSAAALSDELEKMHNNRATEGKLLNLKFMDFEREMESFEEIITSKQQLSTTELVEMKGKLADLKVHYTTMHQSHDYMIHIYNLYYNARLPNRYRKRILGRLMVIRWPKGKMTLLLIVCILPGTW